MPQSLSAVYIHLMSERTLLFAVSTTHFGVDGIRSRLPYVAHGRNGAGGRNPVGIPQPAEAGVNETAEEFVLALAPVAKPSNPRICLPLGFIAAYAAAVDSTRWNQAFRVSMNFGSLP